MRTKEEVQKMLGNAINRTPYMKRIKRTEKYVDALWMAVQVLGWVLSEDVEGDNVTERLVGRLEQLEQDSKK